MSKDPAFLFYPNDYLGGTMGMTFEQKGAYIDLLIFQFNNSHFTEADAKQVLSICFSSVWQVLQNKFKTEGENQQFFFNERLREEIEKRKSFVESRRNNALHEKKTRKAYAKHMGNENENRNGIINNKKYTDDFLAFYEAYPNKKEKQAAFKAWVKIGQNFPGLSVILDAIQKQIDWRKNANGEFRPEWKNPATWLNKGCWDDECKEGGNYGAGTNRISDGRSGIPKEYIPDRRLLPSDEEVRRGFAEIQKIKDAIGANPAKG